MHIVFLNKFLTCYRFSLITFILSFQGGMIYLFTNYFTWDNDAISQPVLKGTLWTQNQLSMLMGHSEGSTVPARRVPHSGLEWKLSHQRAMFPSQAHISSCQLAQWEDDGKELQQFTWDSTIISHLVKLQMR